MTGFLVLGFLGVFLFTLTKNLRSFDKYRPTGVKHSQLIQHTQSSLESRAQAMEAIQGVEEWKTFRLQDLYPGLPASRCQGSQFIGSLKFDGQHGPTHVFDWQLAVSLGKGFATSWFQTVVWFELADARIPNFNLRPHDLPIAVSIPGYEHSLLASLHSAYRLDSPSTSSIQRLFESATIKHDINALLLGDKWHIDRYDNTLTVSVINQLWEPNEIPKLIELAEALVYTLRNAARDADQDLQDRIAAFEPSTSSVVSR